MNTATMSDHTPQGVDKIARYGWIMKDEPGEMRMLHKSVLKIDPAYQRDVVDGKVKAIAAAWSWIGLGALVVAQRGGEFWIIDGQHRALAAMRRSDIKLLPCVVFQTNDVQTEARGFLDLNTGRKAVTAVAKQKAKAAAGDAAAMHVQAVLDRVGLQIKATKPRRGQINCVAWCTKRAADDKDAFELVLHLAAQLSELDDMPVKERLLEGLWFIHAKCGQGLFDKRLRNRLREKGARCLVDAASRGAAYHGYGGGKVWAEAMINEINKGLHNKFKLDVEQA